MEFGKAQTETTSCEHVSKMSVDQHGKSAFNKKNNTLCLPYFHTWCGLSANLECMSEMRYMLLAENTGRQKLPFWHYRTTLSGCIFAAEAYIDNREKIVKH